MLITNNLKQSNNKIELNNKYEFWRWDIDRVTNNRETYKIQQGNHNVKVAIIDSGIDGNHPDLKDNLIYSKSFIPGNSSTIDTLGHGTMVAGEIAANGNLKGVAPKTAIASYKVFDGNKCESSWVINAIIAAIDDGMDVINLSLGTTKSLIDKEDLKILLAYKDAINYAQSKNCIIVAAAGTYEHGINISNPFYLAEKLGYKDDLRIFLPGGLPNIITVSATNRDNKLSYYSNYGANIGVAAPAGDYGPEWMSKKIANLKYMSLVTYPTNLPQSELSLMKEFEKGYEFIQGGTSIAVPKVCGAAALIISEYKERYGIKPSALDVTKLIYDGATSGYFTKNKFYYGNGILNIYNSLKLI
ncbi:TPA: S8 family serine peptidase [Clostridioides difficile]|nr:S8 family serine peptidase [Clostridioides difficile]